MCDVSSNERLSPTEQMKLILAYGISKVSDVQINMKRMGYSYSEIDRAASILGLRKTTTLEGTFWVRDSRS